MSPRLAVLVALLGCAASTGGGSAAPCLDTVAMSTPRGVRVVLPAPLVRHHAKLVSEVLHAVDTTAPEADPRIAPTDVGVPLGFTVYVRQSGAFPVDGPAPGFALGSTDLSTSIWLALRSGSGDDTLPLLPALAHELRHVYTQDPAAGHQ